MGTPLTLRQPDRLAPEASLVFAHAASKDRRLVMRLFGFVTDDRVVRVAAEVHPVSIHGTLEPQWLVNDFETHRLARAFVDEALCSLEHLGCLVTDIAEVDVPAEVAAQPPTVRPG